MPDVKILLDHELMPKAEDFVEFFEPIVAEHMNCWTPDPGGGPQFTNLHEDDIDTTVFDVIGSSNSAVIIEVAASDIPDRMHNITDRIKDIAKAAKGYFVLTEQQKVSITFIPVRQDCWVKV